jgi:hypothetical protein
MKLRSSTLRLHIETWDDPGDYPNGLASGPLPSKQFVESVSGHVTVQLEQSDIDNMEGDTSIEAAQDYLADNAAQVPHEMPGLRVHSWRVENTTPKTALLSVDEFEADVPERGWDE